MQYQPFYGHAVTLQGTVSEDPATDPSSDLQIILKDITIDHVRLPGYAWISASSSLHVQRSDHIVAIGKLSPGFGSVAASMFHANIVAVTTPHPGDVGLQIRDWFAGGIRRAIPEPEASLASGYLVGQRSALPTDLDAELKTVGLTHAVVASGYNLTILVSLARQLLQRVSKYLATVAGVSMIAGFMMISGLSPSMSRAGLVTSLGLAAWYYGRTIHPFVLLPLAAAATALCNPFYVWGDIGWYLSFASFAGVIIIAPLVQRVLWPQRQHPGFIAQTVIDTMSAQLVTLPIMAAAFGHYSPYALIANLLILPFVPLTMLLTFMAGTLSLAAPSLAHLAGQPAELILHYMIWIVAHLADLPGAEGTITFDGFAVAVSYALLGAATAIAWRKTAYSFRREPAVFELEMLQKHE